MVTEETLCCAGEECCDDQVTLINQGVGPPFSKWGCVGGWMEHDLTLWPGHVK